METYPGVNPMPDSTRPPGSQHGAGPAIADPGLPPVAPPSGKFILQMFLVPGLIVGLVVVGLLFMNWLTGGGTASPDKILKALRDGNPEVRWREASELPHKLNNVELATNVSFGLSLVDRLHEAVEESKSSESINRQKLANKKDSEKKPPPWLVTERDFILYLMPALGHLQTPVGAPLLRDLALAKADVDEKVPADAEYDFRRRQLAVLSLSMLGDRLNKFDELPKSRRDAILAALREEAGGDGDRAKWASEALAFLESFKPGRLFRGMGVGEALLKCAKAKEPFVRQLTAQALNFWDADGAEDVLEGLLTPDKDLADDPVIRDAEQDEYRKKHPDEVRNLNNKQIAYNAMQALLRRGSTKVPRHFDIVREMLDENAQRKVWATDEPGQQSARESPALQTVAVTCNALKLYLRTRPDSDLAPLKDSLKRARDSDNPAVSAAAKDVLLLLNRTD